MEMEVVDFMRGIIKEGLAKLTEPQRTKFKHIYSENWETLSVGKVVDRIPDSKLNHALWLVNRTLGKHVKIK